MATPNRLQIRRWSRSGWLPWAILGALAILSAVIVIWAGRDTLFRGDDWDLLLYRQGFSGEVFLFPHNEHLVALQVAVLKLTGALAGLHYLAFRTVLAGVDLAVAALFFAFARQRVGGWLALAATAPLLFLGAASDSLIWPTMIGVMSSLACGLGVLMLLERDGAGARAGACALLLASIGFESEGLFFLLAATIWLVLGKRWRDLWIPALPAIGYFAWYSSHGASQFSRGNLDHAPAFVVDLALSGASALSGVGFSTGHPKAVGALVLLALALGVGWLLLRSRPRLGARTLAIASMPLASWVVVALGRADGGDPFASRYAYASVLFILMALVELLRDTEARRLLAGWPAAALVALVAISIGANLELLREAGDYQRYASQFVSGRAEAIELSRHTIDQNLVIPPLQDMGNMRAGWYLNAVDDFGESPVGRPDIGNLIAPARADADQVLAVGSRAEFSAPRGVRAQGPPPTPDRPGPALHSRGSCLLAGAGEGVEVRLPGDGMLVVPPPGAGATVALRRFGPGFAHEPAERIAGPTLVTVAPDRSRRAWHARVSASGKTKLCGTAVGIGRLLGPPLPAAGDQHCEPFNLGTKECRFRRYQPRQRLERP